MTKTELKKYDRAVKAFWEVFDDETANTVEDMESELQWYGLKEDEWNFLINHWDDLIDSANPHVDIEYDFTIGALRTKVSIVYARLGCDTSAQTVELKGLVDKNVVEILMNFGRSLPVSWGHIKYNEPKDAK